MPYGDVYFSRDWTVKCTVQRRVEGSDIAQALRLAQASVGQNGLLALLSDAHPVIVKRFVNVNNFLPGDVELLILFKGSPEDEIVINSLRKNFLRSKNRKKQS